MAKRTPKIGKDIQSLINLQASQDININLSEQFIQDLFRVTGYQENDEGYIVDMEDDPFDPVYITVKGKKLRHSVQGVLHKLDMIFDPYNNPVIMDELFKKYISQNHPEIVSTQVLAYKTTDTPRLDTYGYITILYGNGGVIQTGLHYKDSTKYLDAYMRLESMTDSIINDTLKPYDDYEKEYFKELELNKLRGKRK